MFNKPKPQTPAPYTGPQWEYMHATLLVTKVADPNELLNNLGAQGWELVNAQMVDLPTVGKARELYFKRQKASG